MPEVFVQFTERKTSGWYENFECLACLVQTVVFLQESDEWPCARCTLLNSWDNNRCIVCGGERLISDGDVSKLGGIHYPDLH